MRLGSGSGSGEKSDPYPLPDPYQIKSLNPDPHPDPHQGDKSNLDAHQRDADPQHWEEVREESYSRGRCVLYLETGPDPLWRIVGVLDRHLE